MTSGIFSALLEIKDPSQYNLFLQNILAFIPITKTHPSFLELHTLYAWEINKINIGKSLKIAILMDKFDIMLVNPKISSEKEAFELIGHTLKVTAVTNLGFFGFTKPLCEESRG